MKPSTGNETPPQTHPLRLALHDTQAEHEWLRAVWQEHRRWIAAILLAHKPRWADLDDLLQEVAVAIVRKVHELRDPQALKPWLRTVAINTALAAGRSGKRRAADVPLDSSTGDQEGVLASFAAKDSLGEGPAPQHAGVSEEGRRLMELARQLPEGYREPLLLKALYGMSYREIGRVMDLPETTVETRIARARRQLRDLAEQPQTTSPADGNLAAAHPRV